MTATADTSAVTTARASARHVRVAPQKARRVVDLIRGRQAADAVAVLRFAPQAASDPVRKVLESAIANARVTADRHSLAFDERTLVVESAYVDEGPTLKRFRPRAQGRASRINKRTSHITVVLAPTAKVQAEPRRGVAKRAAGAAKAAAQKATAKRTTASRTTPTKKTAKQTAARASSQGGTR